MNIKKLALGTLALAFVACNTESNSDVVKVNDKTTDDQKFAYMLGAQFAGQSATTIPRQMGEEIHVDALVQGILDNEKAVADTSFKFQIPIDTLHALNNQYYAIARERSEKARPDSATLASFNGDYAKIQAYVDSIQNTLPINPADPQSGIPMKLSMESSNNLKMSYLLGLQFDTQLLSVGKVLEMTLDYNYYILGIRDAIAKVKDSSFIMQIPQDTLQAIGLRYQKKAEEKRAEARKKFEDEQNALMEKVKSFKGDTLANGMPQKMNYTVKVTGITNKVEDLSSYAGKSLLVFYFSATCGHCQHAAPQVYEIAKAFADKGLTTIAVASGGNNKTGIRKFMDNAKWGDEMNVVWDETRIFGELYSDGYVPKLYVVNPDGTYKLYAAFENDKETMKSDIEALLKGTPVVWNPEPPKTDEAPAAAPAPAAK
ncbi:MULTISPECIES: FKBP-type peptidyl-prolyl cis-trans isomerase N-terminal domain-containing protein [unclassified Fibrobacter]|uniref:FKBP-type peptidyl-prolyl cis-trans isomerase N-terminal domain-containing protein n=1 Tax=unclassified Fibrobacter TaxID=2634177 RepID=UPI000D6B3096|nr:MULTISPECIES: FKBP-type peptidyl-prolyl cis-trans isomerase N-terminal domain-containing protein [unclassified Fibrobacter]PWJ69958.1 FKBP-type peptidyl-prolyl isomerase-like protein [Fibrobacter sp. UWR4]PZW73129.1 FKBP-type peptidyl-prolyl isomerase-like protein [Fibrobacter sp. UWR1]